MQVIINDSASYANYGIVFCENAILSALFCNI